MDGARSTTPRRFHVVFTDHVRPPKRKRKSSTTSYTSLRDVLPCEGGGRHHLNGDLPPRIRNRLEKHATCAYLQPKSVSPSRWSFFDEDADDDDDGDDDAAGLCSFCTRLVSSAWKLFGSLVAVARTKITGHNDRRR